MTKEYNGAILTSENKKHGSIRELQLPYAYIGDLGTHATDSIRTAGLVYLFFALFARENCRQFCGVGPPYSMANTVQGVHLHGVFLFSNQTEKEL